MKRSLALLLSICLLAVFIVPFSAAAEGNEKSSPVLNERIISILKKNDIDFQVVNGNLKLVETSSKSIAEVNKLLVSESKTSLNAIAATYYPTPYTHMKIYDIYRSKKFVAATKTALAAGVIEWAKGGLLPNPYKISIAAAGGFAAYYFINTDTENLYFSIKYYYRELGPGFFDHNGTFIGDYEILKEIRVTNSSSYAGGNLETDARRSSIVEPWF
ncbi:hypothetical protein [Paenibacillus sp. FJAT-26967]|uniref:hypothetical protein n=1 Tax=Paenibacillus sp. FJAT-26967 TaxID=1729690 RepID=UPI0008394EBD|nr:hypothetical protein [Paenibacillus sp. FJAT-26967]